VWPGGLGSRTFGHEHPWWYGDFFEWTFAAFGVPERHVRHEKKRHKLTQHLCCSRVLSVLCNLQTTPQLAAGSHCFVSQGAIILDRSQSQLGNHLHARNDVFMDAVQLQEELVRASTCAKIRALSRSVSPTLPAHWAVDSLQLVNDLHRRCFKQLLRGIISSQRLESSGRRLSVAGIATSLHDEAGELDPKPSADFCQAICDNSQLAAM